METTPELSPSSVPQLDELTPKYLDEQVPESLYDEYETPTFKLNDPFDDEPELTDMVFDVVMIPPKPLQIMTMAFMLQILVKVIIVILLIVFMIKIFNIPRTK